MKKIILTATVAFFTIYSTETFAQHGFGTNTPDKSSAVDIVSTKRGLLIPRLKLTATTVAAPVTEPAQSLLVYNTNTANDVTPGFYYWETNKWVRIMSSNIDKTSSVVNSTTTSVTSASSTNNPNNTEYKVEVVESALHLQNIGGSLNPSQIKSGTNNQVLVTKQTSNGTLTTTWVDPNEVIAEGIVVGDGLTKNENQISLGGNITGDVALNVQNTGSIKITGLTDMPKTGTGAFNTWSDKIMVLNPDGTLKQANVADIISNAIENQTITGKNLSNGDTSITVTGGDGSVLKDASIKVSDSGITAEKIADNAVKTAKIENKAVTATKLDGGTGEAGRVAISDANGNVTYQTLSTSLGKTLTTDGKIVIGNNEDSSLANAVLIDTHIKIKAESIGSTEITNGSIQAEDIKSVGNSKVLVTGANGTVQWIDQTALDNTVTASNGLNKNGTIIELGGTLNKATTISTDATNTLALAGLQKVDTENSILVVDSENKVRTIAQSIAATTSNTLNVVSITDYSAYVQEVNISATATNTDYDIVLPPATAAKGQVINIKLTNTVEVDGYVNIKYNNEILTYGSLPYQGWIIKSNGTNWIILGRN